VTAVDPPHTYTLTVHHIIGDTINVDTVDIPTGGRWTSHLRSHGRARIAVMDADGRLVQTLQYRRAERIEVSCHG
jgi:hypothetical protein